VPLAQPSGDPGKTFVVETRMIAVEPGISMKTVESHQAEVLEKPV
jgi:hypothetical protein